MNFKPAQIESFCRNPNPDVKCIVLFGNNEGAIAMLQKKCAEAVCGDVNDAFRYAALEMDDVSKDGGEVYAEFHAQSLMGGRRAVVVKNADNNLAAFHKNMIPETVSENLLILSSTSLNTRSSLITWAKDRADVIIVGCYEERESDIAEDTERMLHEKGLTIDMPTLQLLCSRLSPDRKINQGEIDKLAMYLGERKNVTRQDAEAAVSDVAGANIEDLCYYTAGGDVTKATAVFNRLIKEGEDASMLIRQLSYHFMKLLDCGAQIENGATTDGALKSLRPPLMFYRKDDFTRQLRIWRKDYLMDALGKLYDCERDCKTTGMPAEEIASYTIMRLAGAAQKLLKRN
ncbi:MAG: DNA polymerase III subunit delta [Alphaproteobacteria bacterium]|nr:DNA polymerase III subunit delta [Alphaproteobacteria bacterium]